MSSDLIQLSDMLESYPPATLPGFQTMITSKEEFRELASYPNETPPEKRGDYFNHQKFTHRFLRTWDDLLLIDETGTGKSCSAVGFFEYAQEEMRKRITDPRNVDEKVSHFKRVIVLVKGPTQKNEFRNQLVCRCSVAGKYDKAENVIRATESGNEKQQKKAVSMEIKKSGYIVTTYLKFARTIEVEYPETYDMVHEHGEGTDEKGKFSIKNFMLIVNQRRKDFKEALKNMTQEERILAKEERKELDRKTKEKYDKRLIQDYSDSIFWADEVHNLIIEEATDSEQLKAELGNKEIPDREKVRTRNTINRIFHLIKRSKRLLSTATPMINGTKDLITVLNFILPQNGSLPLNYNWRTAPKNDIRVLFPNLLPITYDWFNAPETFNNILQDPDIISLMATHYQNITGTFPPPDFSSLLLNKMNPIGDMIMGLYFKGQLAESDITDGKIENLEPYFRGRIGYVRASPPKGIISKDMGIPINVQQTNDNGEIYISQLTIEVSNMEQHQDVGYKYVVDTYKGENFFIEEKQAANFVFPDSYSGEGVSQQERERNKQKRKLTKYLRQASLGQATGPKPQEIDTSNYDTIEHAYKKYVRSDKKGNYFFTNEMKEYLYAGTDGGQDDVTYYSIILENIRKLSCKYARIIELIIEGGPGNAFVYQEKVEGSGVIVLGLCFEIMGFDRFRETSSIFQGTGRNIRNVCSDSSTNRQVKSKFKNEMTQRYGLLTGSTTDKEFETMMETMNSKENMYGDHIKVLLSSRVGRDGINVNNCVQIHLDGPDWHQGGMYQAISRGLRATSHEDLLKAEKERLIDLGLDEEPEIVVGIYRHAAIPLDEKENSIDFNDLQSYVDQENVKDRTRTLGVDLVGYLRAEKGDINIKSIMRIMKQCSVNCQINKNRNILPPENDYSQSCDYSVCDYECVNFEPDTIDYSTYDVLYVKDNINSAIKALTHLFQKQNSNTLKEIIEQLPNFRPKYLVMALEQLITNKIQLLDRFGFTAYLREDNEIFYLDRIYPIGVEPSYSSAYYSDGLIAIEKETLGDISTKINSDQYRDTIDSLEQMETDDPQFDEILSNLDIEGQIVIVENIITRYVEKLITNLPTGNSFDMIKNKYKNTIFVIHDPVESVIAESKKINEPQITRGRKRDAGAVRKPKKINPNNIEELELNIDETTELVYIHTLYSLIRETETKYDAVSRYNKGEGRIRILKLSEIENE